MKIIKVNIKDKELLEIVNTGNDRFEVQNKSYHSFHGWYNVGDKIEFNLIDLKKYIVNKGGVTPSQINKYEVKSNGR